MHWFERVIDATSPRPAVLIRLLVGGIALSEGVQKFLFPAVLGVGRFIKIGLPYPAVLAPFVGLLEVTCGVLVLLGLLSRLASIPLLITITVAIVSTKLPMLRHDGFWKMAHESRPDYAMWLGSLFLMIAGSGPISVDRWISRRYQQRVIRIAAG